MKITIDWDIFKENISNLIKVGEEIKQQLDSNKKFEDEKKKVIDWQNKLLAEFENSFDISNNEFTFEIKNAFKEPTNSYVIPTNTFNRNINIPKNIEQENREKNISLSKNLEGLLRTLKFYLKFLSASDAVIYPNKIDINDRSNYKTEDILSLILNKLYILYDTNYISIINILSYNGIKLDRYGEERELAKVLENRGLINIMSGRDVSAQLTLSGKMFIEEFQKRMKPNYENINENQVEFENTIDEILSKLEKLGYGQEIIFEEIEELKNLHLHLNKKNFGQILKGKLVDLALSKTIENDTISYIYHKITEEILKLP